MTRSNGRLGRKYNRLGGVSGPTYPQQGTGPRPPGTGPRPVPKPKPIGTPGGPRPAQNGRGRIFGAGCSPACDADTEICIRGKCHSTEIGIPQAYPGQSRPGRPLKVKASKPKRMSRRKRRTNRRSRRYSGMCPDGQIFDAVKGKCIADIFAPAPKPKPASSSGRRVRGAGS